ncbi:MAG TPA: ATP-binding cassette domain-containing protein [Bacteroidales bacterium]
MQTLLAFDQVSFKRNNELIFENLSWEVKKGENWAVTGKSGSGKSTLLEALHGNFLVYSGSVLNYFGFVPESGIYGISKHASFVFFKDSEINYNNYYYQQRYNSMDVEGTFTLRRFLFGDKAISEISGQLFNNLQLEELLDKEFIKLSNGETRKALLAKALLKNPKLLVLDNPYTGLDKEARSTVNATIDQLIDSGIQIIMVGDSRELPQKITHILKLENFRILHAGEKEQEKAASVQTRFAPDFKFEGHTWPSFDIAVKLTDVMVHYDKVILDHIRWTIRRNEKWALTGRNGAGKSMLISLIYADNPQAYANEIILFDKARGNGESIWDIKERIGFISPELHFYFDMSLTCRETALKGLSDNPYRKVEQKDYHHHMLQWLFHYFNIESLTDKPMDRLSTGQQRLVLFISVLMKNPALLLLDEPFQGFDHTTVEKAKVLLDIYCKDRTLVFVSHRQEEIPTCVNNFAMLTKGKITLSNGNDM